MAFVVAEPCVACKYTDCVAVCPVDCFYEGVNWLVIHPDECIDCGRAGYFLHPHSPGCFTPPFGSRDAGH